MASSIRRLLAVIAGAMLGFPALAAAQQGATITGRVTGDGGAPLGAVQVYIEELSIGSQTQDDGRYTINVPASRVSGQRVTLTARRIGYRNASEAITLSPGTIQKDFVLAFNPLQLGEVVVTGAGTSATREKIGTAITTVDSALIQRANEANVVSALAGKAPNVEINTQSGEPGASAYIRIRGAKSINGTGQPLFVVDGVPIDNTTYSTTGNVGSTVAPNRASDLNPADIESVNILKGAAAAAIYGARAAEGVVLITTKSGKAGQTRYSLRSNSTWDDVTRTVPLQTKYGQGSGGVPAVASCTGFNCALGSGSFGPELNETAMKAGFQSSKACAGDAACATALYNQWFPNGIQVFDHAGEIFHTGHTFDNTLTVSGGSERTTFYLSGGRMDQSGTIIGPNNRYDKTTARLKATHRVFDRLTLGGNFSYIDTRGAFVQKGSNTSGLLLGALRTPPEFNNRQYLDTLYGLHRSYRFPRPGSASLTTGRRYDNPFFVALANPANRSELGRVIGNLTVDYEPLDWLRINYNLGGDYYNDWRLEGLPFTSSGYPKGDVVRADITNLQLDHNLVATATHTFSPSFAGSLALGQNLNARRYRLASVDGTDLIGAEPFALQNTINWQPFEDRSLVHTESYFLQAQADLFNQLHLTATVRNDGFSTFGASKLRHTFPQMSAAWVFTNALGNTEGRGLLSFGKVRAAYGEAGKEPPVYATITAYDYATFGGGWGDYLNATQNNLGGLATGGQIGNNALRPERTKEFETGFDVGLFDQRVDASVTYYNSRSVDVILSAPVSAAAKGVYTELRNAARISNTGVETSLNLRPVSTQGITWDVNLQWARNRNNVLDLLGAEFVDKSSGSFEGSYGSVTKGVGVGVLRGQDFARCGRGLVIDGRNIDQECGAGYKKDALFIDVGGLPIVDPTDRVIADPNPKWTGGIGSSITLGKKWQISGLLHIRHGGDVWNGTKGALYFFGKHKDTEVRDVERTYGKDYFVKKYPDVAGPGANTAFTLDQDWYEGQGGGFGDVAAQFIEDGSFVKLREISVAYTLDQPWVSRNLGFSSIDLRLAGRNLKTWTKYTGLDPESNLAGAEVLVQGIDYFNNPQTRSIVFTIGLNR